MIVDDRRLLLHLGGAAADQRDLGRRHILPAGIVGKLRPDGLLEIGRLHGVDGENGGETQLANDLMGRGVAVLRAGTTGKQHVACSFST